MFIEDTTHLFNRADPTMPEATKVRHLMRGVKEQLFAGLMRDPSRTVAAFAKEATTMERSLQERSAEYGAHVWRTSNNRPLCYHCWEHGHILRNYPYRRLGLRGFPPDARRPRYGERSQDIEEYLTTQVLPPTSQRRQSRSPSPRRFASPSHPSSSGQFRGTSPCREN
ncbi:uncharacterized protein LOC144133862 [Amblyomma americanum]